MVHQRVRTSVSAQHAADLRARRPEVIDDLLGECGPAMQGVAYLILRNHADAEEVVVDTMVTAWQKAHTLRNDEALRTWLLRIATRHALSRRRRRRPQEQLAPEHHHLLTDRGVDPDRLALSEAVALLPPRMRAAIALHHYAGLTVAETASALGKSENTIKTQLREGLARLRETLASDDADRLGRSIHVRGA